MLTWRGERRKGKKQHTQKANANDTLGSSEQREATGRKERKALSCTRMRVKVLPESLAGKESIIIISRIQ